MQVWSNSDIFSRRTANPADFRFDVGPAILGSGHCSACLALPCTAWPAFPPALPCLASLACLPACLFVSTYLYSIGQLDFFYCVGSRILTKKLFVNSSDCQSQTSLMAGAMPAATIACWRLMTVDSVEARLAGVGDNDRATMALRWVLA